MNNARPEGQGKPAGEEPTPIEQAYRTTRRLLDTGSPAQTNELTRLAEDLRQAAIYDASHRTREENLTREAVNALRDVLRARRDLVATQRKLGRVAALAVALTCALVLSAGGWLV